MVTLIQANQIVEPKFNHSGQDFRDFNALRRFVALPPSEMKDDCIMYYDGQSDLIVVDFD